MTVTHWIIVAAVVVVAAGCLLWTRYRPRIRQAEAQLPPSMPIGQTDPRVADLEHMADDEIARFIADCAEAADVVKRQWAAAQAELADRHRARHTADQAENYLRGQA